MESIFTPFKIGNCEIKNRVVLCPMGIHSSRLCNSDGSYTDTAIDYFVRRAEGGTGLIVTGVMQVQDMFELFPNKANVSKAGKEYVQQMKKLADGCHKYGAKVFVQLSSGFGRVGAPIGIKGELIAAGNDMPNVWVPSQKHRALTVEEIHKYIEGFAHGAKCVKESGCDGVEIHAVHEGYLLDQFSISYFNNRTDEYGGSLENRLRFAREVVEAIKKACGNDFPVMLRYSVKSYIKGFNDGALPGEKFVEAGRDYDESKKVIKLLEDYGYDAFDCDNGTYDSWYYPHPPVYMPDACNLEDVKLIKKCVTKPVICAGKMGNPKYAAESISKGEIDAVGLARPLLCDPDWTKKVQKNDIEDIRPCISCQVGCLGRLVTTGGDMTCALNPTCCHEKELQFDKAPKSLKIVIVGGGIGGMEAARVSALRGHNVELFEKSDHLGGVFVPAASMTFKHEERRLIKWYERQMKINNVNVHLNTEATVENIKALNPDHVIVATGATTRYLKGIEGCENSNVIYAVDALNNRKSIGQNVVIIGAGLTGIEMAYELSKEGKKVQVVEMKNSYLDMPDLCMANAQMLKQIVKYYQIPVHLSSTLTKITPNSVEWTANNEKKSAPADTVIVSIGYISNKKLSEQLNEAGLKPHLIGDADHVSNLLGAIHSAYRLAYKL
ncbi:hypothetical protein M9Y10_037888 [Tritrichomonas musculus]|uniref:2-enoate reductase n=1 Tax=Tritrichomonas musculus TaxID=1915356 RepID=A0ABR2K6Z7_9EUKA